MWYGMETLLGVFDSWAECHASVKGFPGAVYKSFPTREEAEAAFHSSPDAYIQKKKKKAETTDHAEGHEIPRVGWTVDAACSGNPGDMEYRAVNLEDWNELFRQGPFKMGTNNIGEFLAIVHALAVLKKDKNPTLPVYTDSRTALSWIRKKKSKYETQKNSFK